MTTTFEVSTRVNFGGYHSRHSRLTSCEKKCACSLNNDWLKWKGKILIALLLFCFTLPIHYWHYYVGMRFSHHRIANVRASVSYIMREYDTRRCQNMVRQKVCWENLTEIGECECDMFDNFTSIDNSRNTCCTTTFDIIDNVFYIFYTSSWNGHSIVASWFS